MRAALASVFTEEQREIATLHVLSQRLWRVHFDSRRKAGAFGTVP